MRRISELRRVSDPAHVTKLIEGECERTGGVFRLAPTWVGRPGIIVPGRRIKLLQDYMSRDVAVNERWLASVTYADNGAFNSVCPPDHGLSYLVIDSSRVQLKDALATCGDLLLGRGKTWDVLPKFFDNWHRIPNHLHPCDAHCSPGLRGKPESYYFPEELNMDRNAFPSTCFGVDPAFTDEQILATLRRYMSGDNRLTDLGNTINIIPGTGWFMPACTLHAPGSLVTYELQVASDVTCIPESRVNDMVMPQDLVDRDIPVKIATDGLEAVARYVLSMVRCKASGNGKSFRQEFFRAPVTARRENAGEQSWVIYRTGPASLPENPDLYTAKKTSVAGGMEMEISEKAAFGVIVLRGHGTVRVDGREAVSVETASMYPDTDTLGGDELFVSAEAAKSLRVGCQSVEDMAFYQHFASGSNPETRTLSVPEYVPFA